MDQQSHNDDNTSMSIRERRSMRWLRTTSAAAAAAQHRDIIRKRNTISIGRLFNRGKYTYHQRDIDYNGNGDDDDDGKRQLHRHHHHRRIGTMSSLMDMKGDGDTSESRSVSPASGAAPRHQYAMIERDWKDLVAREEQNSETNSNMDSNTTSDAAAATAIEATADSVEIRDGQPERATHSNLTHGDQQTPNLIKFRTILVMKQNSSSASSSEEDGDPLRAVASVDDMMANGDKVDCFDVDSISDPIFLAVATGDVESLREMIDQDGAIVEREYEIDQCKPLHLAALRNQMDVMELLIGSGAIVDSLTSFHATPLHLACSKGHREAVQYLVSNGADVKQRDMYGYSPLHVALQHGKIDVAEDLLLFGVDIDYKKFDGKTALHVAAEAGRIESVKWLIEQGARTTVKDEKGNTFIFGAVRRNRLSLVRFLTAQPKSVCNFTAVNNTFSNIIHVCIDHDLFDMISLIAELRPIDFTLLANEQDKVIQRTPLHYAVQKNKIAIVELLLSFDFVNPNIQDARGQTPLHLLLDQPEQQIQDELLKKLLMVPRVRLNIKGGPSKKTCRQLLSKMKRFRRYLKEIRQLHRVYESMERSNDRTIVIPLNAAEMRNLKNYSAQKDVVITTGSSNTRSNTGEEEFDDIISNKDSDTSFDDTPPTDCTQQ